MKKSGKVTSRSDRSIATRIKALMESRQWDQKDLAQRLDLSEGYISRILSGERPWPVALVFRAAQVFEVPVSELDPALETVLKQDLENLELRRDVPHLKVLHAFIRDLPRITDPEDLEALIRVLHAFADHPGAR
jgi:transcriptional regulator with XRE-family HTH domain